MKFLIILFPIFCASMTFADQTKNSYYGYFQTDFIRSNEPTHDYGFLLRRVNFIGDFLPQPKTRLLADIEFEEGADISVSEIKGNIKVSRLFAEQSLNKSLRVKIGRFLTPFGLYNEIHDFSVAYYSIEVPLIYQPLVLMNNTSIATRLISKYNTGVWLSGNTSGNNRIEYDIYFGNGRDEELDGSDSNKNQSFGLRGMYFPTSKKNLNIGFSYYQDTNEKGLKGNPKDQEKSFDYHLQYETSLFQIQMEAIMTQLHGADKKSTSVLGSYAQLAWNATEKNTVYYQYGDVHYNTTEQITENRVGTGYLFNPQFILKIEYQNFSDAHNATSKYNETYLSAAMAF